MYPSSLIRALPLITALVPGTIAQNSNDAISRAELALQALQTWYNAESGLWDTSGWWNSANAINIQAAGDFQFRKRSIDAFISNLDGSITQCACDF